MQVEFALFCTAAEVPGEYLFSFLVDGERIGAAAIDVREKRSERQSSQLDEDTVSAEEPENVHEDDRAKKRAELRMPERRTLEAVVEKNPPAPEWWDEDVT